MCFSFLIKIVKNCQIQYGANHEENLEKSARKKKVILGILAVVVVLILLLVILSEFGAFSGGGGETRIIERNNYIYVLQNGTRVESAEPREDLKVHEVPSTTSTVTTTTSAPPLAISEEPDYEGSAPADDFWEADYTEDNK